MDIGIVGCGAIGSRLATSICKDMGGICRLNGVFDSAPERSRKLAESLGRPEIVRGSLPELLENCQLMVEAVNTSDSQEIIRQALGARRHVLVMSVGRLIDAADIVAKASESRAHLLIPSGAIAGIDAVKAAAEAGLKTIVLTTRKPPAGLEGNPYLEKQGIDLSAIEKETVLFDGPASEAVLHFPQNINVAATLVLASGAPEKVRVRILTAPDLTSNSHEVEITGDFGRIVTRTDNRPCPDNPKTSYLAVLSAIRTLKDFCNDQRVGT